MDEPATARALSDFVVRALDCGATDEQEVRRLTGLDRPAIDRLARRDAPVLTQRQALDLPVTPDRPARTRVG